MATGVKTTDPVLVSCQYWSNPLSPMKESGYNLVTLDQNDFAIDQTDSANPLALDATAYKPFPIKDSSIVYTTGTKEVQASTYYTITIASEVKFEITGCYVKYNFPRELQVREADLTTFTAAALLVGSDGATNVSPVAKDLTTPGKQWVLFKGCQNKADKGARGITQVFQLKMDSITNPLSVRATSPFLIQIYKDYDATAGLTNMIAEATTSLIPQTDYRVREVSTITVTATDMIV